MAVNVRAVHACIGFTNGSDDNIVDAQGIDSVRELGHLNDEDVINLCKPIHCPGGHLPNPAFVAGGAMNPTIPCAGIMVSQRGATNTQLAFHCPTSQQDQLGYKCPYDESDLHPNPNIELMTQIISLHPAKWPYSK
jgi:hypothetical protein